MQSFSVKERRVRHTENTVELTAENNAVEDITCSPTDAKITLNIAVIEENQQGNGSGPGGLRGVFVGTATTGTLNSDGMTASERTVRQLRPSAVTGDPG
jgi:hypothetical protein